MSNLLGWVCSVPYMMLPQTLDKSRCVQATLWQVIHWRATTSSQQGRRTLLSIFMPDLCLLFTDCNLESAICQKLFVSGGIWGGVENGRMVAMLRFNLAALIILVSAKGEQRRFKITSCQRHWGDICQAVVFSKKRIVGGIKSCKNYQTLYW